VDESGNSSNPFRSVLNNSVVIPTYYNGPFEIVLEASNDLVNWTPALPGECSTETSSGVFFQVRAISK